jgi:hypothetical protein
MFDDAALTKFNAIVLIANIVRTDRFGEKYRKPSNWIRTEDKKSAARASYILAKLVAIATDLAERIIHDRTQDVEEHRANVYLHALSTLVRLASSIPHVEPLNLLYQNICLTQKTPFSRQARECLQILANQQSRIEFDTLILPFTQLNRRMSKSVADDFSLFAQPLFTLVSNLDLHLKFIPVFLEHIMFQKWPVLSAFTSQILHFCQVLLESQRNEMISQVDMKMDKYGLSNFVMMVNFYEIVQVKRPILGLFTTVIQKGLLQNEIDLTTFVLRALDTAEVRANDRERLEELLRRDDISGETHARILAFLKEIDSGLQG